MPTVKPIPDGYHTITPLLNVEGAAEAIEFYKKAFGAEERTRMPSPDGKIMHAEIKIGDSIVMLGDAVMNAPTKTSLHLYVTDADALWNRAVTAGCEIVMPIENAFWGDRYGVLSDRWGNRWGICTHIEDVSPEEMQRRGEEAMKKFVKPS